jgi:hypothetical protein
VGESRAGVPICETLGSVEPVHDLVLILVGPGDQHPWAVERLEFHGAGGQVVVLRKLARLDAVRRDQRDAAQQATHRLQQRFAGQRGAASGRGDRVEHDGLLRVVAEHGGHRIGDPCAAEQADLESRDRQVGEHGARLGLDQFRVDRLDTLDVARVLHGQRGRDRERAAADSGQGLDVGLQPGAATRVVSREGQHDRGRAGLGRARHGAQPSMWAHRDAGGILSTLMKVCRS